MSKVLVVDDQLELRTLFSRLLENQGHAVVAVGNGSEALRSTETWVPDLILLDLAMPEMDGLTFLRAIRKRDGWLNVPVIMLSGLMSPQQVADARALGVADQLVKGKFSTRELRASVARCLAGNKSETAGNAA